MSKITPRNLFVVLLMLVMIFALTLNISDPVRTQAAGGMVWEVTQRTTSDFNKGLYGHDFQLSGTKIYYIWSEHNATNQYEIWTAEMNTDGTGWVATKRTTTNYRKWNTRMDIEGTKIYYTWDERDASNVNQIWTAEMNLDGTGWVATKRTNVNSSHVVIRPDIDVSGTKVYLAWEDYGNNSLYVASMNLDGSGFTSVQVAANSLWSRKPRITVSGTKIYMVYEEWRLPAGYHQKLVTAVINTDLTGFAATDQVVLTNGTEQVWDAELILDGTKLYYLWIKWSSHINTPYTAELWLGQMNTDGTGFQSEKIYTMQNTVPVWQINYDNFVLDGSKLHLTWDEFDSGGNNQIFTGSIDTDFSDFQSIQRTLGSDDSSQSNLLINGSEISYIYLKIDGSNKNQIWTSTESNKATGTSDANVTATIPSSLTLSIAGVSSGAACANSGGNASVTTTATTVPFGLYTGAQTKIACQTLTLSTNATDGYVVTVQQNQDLTSTSADMIDKFTGVPAPGAPVSWASPSGGADSYFGFTTNDADYSGYQVSKYAGFTASNSPYAVAAVSGPIDGEVHVVSYQLEVNTLQEAGTYTNNLMYIATGRF